VIKNKLAEIGLKIEGTKLVAYTSAGWFSFPANSIYDAIQNIKKEMPASIPDPSRKTTFTLGETPKKNYQQIAQSFDSYEDVLNELNNHVENLETANKSGNKALSEVFSKEVAKWKSIAEYAHNTDYEGMRLNKLADSDQDIDKLFNVTYDKRPEILSDLCLSKRNIFDLREQFKPADLKPETVFCMYWAKEISEHQSVGNFIYDLSGKVELNKQGHQNDYCKNDGRLKSLSHRQREYANNTQRDINNQEILIKNLLKYAEYIQSLKECICNLGEISDNLAA
jgi:hypothetical protein